MTRASKWLSILVVVSIAASFTISIIDHDYSEAMAWATALLWFSSYNSK